MRITIAPDSFKGTIFAAEAAKIIGGRFSHHFPGAEVLLRPLADGGEGTVDCFVAAGGAPRMVETEDAFGSPVTARYCVLGSGAAVAETASAAGYAPRGERNPEVATTAGLGAVFKAALAAGCGEILLGLGGSATNDGGAGLAAALGVKFFDGAGRAFVPTGATLQDVADIDVSACARLLEGVRVTGLCDVTNPFFGPEGAALVFAPQKGANEAMVARLDSGMERFASVIKAKLGVDVQAIPGSGAAGGLGGGLAAFLGAELRPGIDEILRLFPLDGSDLIVTGEGCIDAQTAFGKTVSGVLRRAGGAPVVAIGGLARPESRALYESGIAAVCAVNRVEAPFEKVASTAAADLEAESDAAARLIRTGMALAAKKEQTKNVSPGEKT